MNTYTADDQSQPSVAGLQDGDFVVTWHSDGQDGSGFEVYGQLFDRNGTKIGNEFRTNTYVTLNQIYPSVASVADGNFVVTWQSDGQDGDSWGVYGQLFDGNGTKIGNEFRANSYTTGYQRYPLVASLADGNFVVAWNSDQDGSGYEVYGQLFNGNGSNIGSEFRANTYVTFDQYYPSVASLADGTFVVTWESENQDGSDYGVYGQLFDRNGSKIGNELQINTYRNFSQRKPSVASFPNGNFVVTWHSDGQDGSDFGIFGQIFNDFIVSNTTNTTTSSTTSSSTIGPSSSTTTSSTTSSSTIGPSSSTTTSSTTSSSTTVPSKTRPKTTSNSRATFSTTSDPRHRFSWIWFLLGSIGAISCLGLTRYYFFKSRNRKKDGDALAFALGEREQPKHSAAESDDQSKPDRVKTGDERQYGRLPDHSAAETHDQRTPDFVRAGREPVYGRPPDFVTRRAGQEPIYGLTPDHVTERAGEEPLYGSTPHFVTRRAGQEPIYGLTPDHVTERAGEEPLYGSTPHFVTERAGQDPIYGLTPDHVTERAGEEPLYGSTPHFVAGRAGQEPHYGRTPDEVGAGDGEVDQKTSDEETTAAEVDY